jgi:alpha-ribazole phosphatase/probable phosphoglycerate mutase
MEQMKPCLLIRHGETDLAGLFCGHSDPPLNGAGRLQVQHAADLLADTPPDVIYSSDLQRATQTAQMIAQRFGLSLIVRPGLREICFGDWEGLSWAKIEDQYPTQAKLWIEQYPAGSIPSGEAFEMFQLRVRTELEFLLEQAENRAVVAVTHGGFIRTALTDVYGLSTDAACEKSASYAAIVPFHSANPVPGALV